MVYTHAPSSLLSLLPLLLSLLLLLPLTSSQSADIEVRLNEEEAVGTFVANLSRYPTLFLEVSSDDRHKLSFNILDQTSYQESFFQMDSSSGVISLAKRLDREAVCHNALICALEFNVAIRGTAGLTFSNIASVKVHVDDINDNSPQFPTDEAELEISEGARVGTVLTLSGPQDLDALPNNTIQRYEVTLQPPPVFSVSATKNPDGTSFLSLRLEQGLDRETTELYDFNIIAYDGGNPPKSDFLRVVVRVTDENDNVPLFEQESYDVSVRGDTQVGSEVVRVRASDLDAGSFGTVRYRFSGVTSEEIRALFQINATTGSITLKTRIERTASSSPYSLVVEAFDGGPTPSQAVVTITVLNTGNNAPIVRLVTVAEGDTTEISLTESSTVGDFVAFVNVEDNDEGDNGDFNCSLVDAPEFRLMPVPNKGYQVLLYTVVDRELVPTYDAGILCRDGGSPPLSTQISFTVVITDINDNDPEFSQPSYTASVAENNAVNQYLLQATATDADSGDNAVLTYGFLEPQALDFLAVHPQTGIVTARVPLDREGTPVLTYTLTAVDRGDSPRTGTASLTITIRDVNDNAPQLQGVPYHFSVSEGARPGFLLATMAASDLDLGVNGLVEFFFAGSVNGEVPFTVHTNGTIEVSGVLDRETSARHVFTVLARDKGAIPRSNSTQVMVTVTDINDNPPVILFPTSVNHSVVITTLPEKGIILGRVIAYDVDEGNASSLEYSIYRGNPQGVFGIDPWKGEIFLEDLDKLKNPHIYHVVLRVYDLGVPPLFAETSLQIEVMYPNLTGAGGVPWDQEGAAGKGDEKSRDSYVVIVGVIGGATAVLSGIIIGAIVFVLRSEKHRKPRDCAAAYKNEYVPAPARFDVPTSEKGGMDSKFPSSPDRKSSLGDLSSSGVILSPKGLATQKPEVQKKVSFSLDEPDGDVRPIQSRELLLPVPVPHSSQQEGAGDAPSVAWKRLVSPDDINSDTSGDSGTCDSGRGASDDDIHQILDSSMDKRSHAASPAALTSTTTTPASSRTLAQPNVYSPPSFTGSFRQGQDQGHSQGQGYGYGQGQGQAGRPRFLHTGGSYHSEGPRGKRPQQQQQQPLPLFPQHQQQAGSARPPSRQPPFHHSPSGGGGGGGAGGVVSLHPEPWPQRHGGSRRSLDLPAERRGAGGSGGGGEGGKWMPPPRPSSSMAHPYSHALGHAHAQRHGSVASVEEDNASTTTSGSYTISPDELRLEGMVSPDVIV